MYKIKKMKNMENMESINIDIDIYNCRIK